MSAVYVAGALLWAYVLVRLLRRIADRRKALAAWQARRAEAEHERTRLMEQELQEADNG